MTAPIQRLSLPLVAKILSYVNHTGNKSELVSRVFCAARQKAMQEEWSKGAFMSDRGSAFPLELLQQEIAVGTGLWAQLRGKLKVHFPPKREIAQIWGQMVNCHGCSYDILKAQEEIFREQPTLYSHVLSRWKEHVNQRIALLDQDPVDWQEQVRCIRAFNAREGLALRERRIQLLEEGDPENPKQITYCFEKLYKEQKERACLTLEGERAFKQIPLNFSFLSNLSREFVVQDTEAEMLQNLHRIWCRIRQKFNPLPAGIPGAAGPTAAVREWMNDPVNRPHLDKIRHLYIRGEANQEITAIPREIENLRYLSGLQMSGVGRLPCFLTKMRYLQHVYADNQLTEIPDALYRHLESSLYLLEGRNGHIYGAGRLERIPFRMWFKQNLLLPHFSLTACGFDCLFNIWRHNAWRHGFIDFISHVIVGAIFGPIDLLLNAPIFLFNLLMIDVIEPIVTLVRDLSGISRMVRIR